MSKQLDDSYEEMDDAQLELDVDGGNDDEDRGDDFEPTDDDADEGNEDDGDAGSEDDVDSDDETEEESDPSSDEEGAEEDEELEDDDAEDDQDDARVPISRLNQVIGQREEEKQRSEWLEDQLEKLLDKQLQGDAPKVEAAPAYDYAAGEAKYVEMILEGEAAKASAVRAEIDAARQAEFKELIAQTQAASKENSTTASKAALEESRFETLRENYENKHAFLNSESDDYNEEAVDTVNTLMMGLVASGETKSAALKKAVAKAAPMYKRAAATPDKAKRAKKQRVKNVKAAKKQAPKMKGKSSAPRNLDDVAVSKMTDKQYGSLTARERAVLRGDIVE